jgi:DNA-binding PadR family transcriptional regulator
MTGRKPGDMLPLPYLAHMVLLALAEGEAHGWALIKRIQALTGERANPSTGSLYLAIARLQASGLLEAIAAPEAESDARRRYYRLLPFGRQVLLAETARLSGLVARVHDLRLYEDGAPDGNA